MLDIALVMIVDVRLLISSRCILLFILNIVHILNSFSLGSLFWGCIALLVPNLDISMLGNDKSTSFWVECVLNLACLSILANFRIVILLCAWSIDFHFLVISTHLLLFWFHFRMNFLLIWSSLAYRKIYALFILDLFSWMRLI